MTAENVTHCCEPGCKAFYHDCHPPEWAINYETSQSVCPAHMEAWIAHWDAIRAHEDRQAEAEARFTADWLIANPPPTKANQPSFPEEEIIPF